MTDKENSREDEWVRQLCEGSRTAFTGLFGLYADRLYGYAHKLTKSPILAEDVVQETFLRVWENRKNLRPDTSFQSYLYQISYHLVIDAFRRQIDSIDIETYTLSSDNGQSVENEAENRLTTDDYRLHLSQSLSRLTPKQQEIFRLSRESELSPEEIAVRTGLSEKTVRNQLSIILAELKKDLLLYTLFLAFIQG